ncbi:MAG: MFS transporter [Patescibacteria group bacterium]
MRLTPYKRLLLFVTTTLWFSAFARTILPAYYLSQGITLYQMIVATLLAFGAQLTLLLSIRRGRAKSLWKISLLANLVSLLLVIQLETVWQYYLASALFGIAMATFWVAYNIAYFGATPKEKTGLGSAIMFSVFPMLNIVAPPLAGFIMQWNTPIFWLISIAFFGIAYLFIDKQEDFQVNYSLVASLSEIKATRIFLFLEGIWEALPFAIIPVYTLYFIQTPLSYGAFSAYLALISVAANLLLGKTTDRLQKRILFLYPLTLVLAATTFMFPQATGSLALWLLVTGIINFFVPLFWNISTSMIVDTHANLPIAIPGREIMLATGRVTGFILTLISFSFEPRPLAIFFILWLILLMYPFYLWWISRFKKKYVFR